MWADLLTLACVLLLLPAQALAGAKEKVTALAPSGLVLVMDEKGNELLVQNADKPFVPASVTKIVTAWLAMEVLGGDYRFETRFYLDGDRVLYIGGGDPFLISEELAQLASELVVAIGKKPLSGIVLDASYYPSDISIPGIEDTDEAYDALNSALAANFNTIHAVRKGKTVRSAEKQTPITPLAISQFRARGPRGSRSHQPDPGPRGGPAIRRRTDRRVHRAGRQQRQGQDLDRGVPRALGAGLRSPSSRAPFRRSSPGCSSARTTTSQPGLPGDRRASPGRARHLETRSRSRTRCSPSTASPEVPSISRKARASAAATTSRPAALPSCCTSSSPMPPCSAAARARISRPALFPASAPWRAIPTLPSMGECAS